MSQILELRGCVREYAWGSPSFLPDLLGTENVDDTPQAELWMGAHPSAVSVVRVGDDWVALTDWIATDPVVRLGESVVQRFGGELPFLLKVLAAAYPLSLQAHPDPEQARVGFERENRKGLPLDAPNRSYRDARPKPELLCALTPFDAMLGFREVAEIHELLRALELPVLAPALAKLCGGAKAELRDFFGWLIGSDEETRAQIAGLAAERCSGRSDAAAGRWVVELAGRYPGDIGVLAPLLLNVIRLEVGQAVYLPAGELHSYLGGCGIEIMANSDNVLRGGLTNKHVDVPGLLEVLTFSSGPPRILDPGQSAFGIRTYGTPVADFELTRIDVAGEHVREATDSVEILLCVEGAARVEASGGSQGIEFARGRSLLVPADAGGYRVLGNCCFFRAGVPGGS